MESDSTASIGEVLDSLNIQLTSADSTLLFDISKLCPYEYGETVYQARAKLSAFYPDFNTIINPCEYEVSVSSVEFAKPEAENNEKIKKN